MSGPLHGHWVDDHDQCGAGCEFTPPPCEDRGLEVSWDISGALSPLPLDMHWCPWRVRPVPAPSGPIDALIEFTFDLQRVHQHPVKLRAGFWVEGLVRWERKGGRWERIEFNHTTEPGDMLAGLEVVFDRWGAAHSSTGTEFSTGSWTVTNGFGQIMLDPTNELTRPGTLIRFNTVGTSTGIGETIDDEFTDDPS